MNSKIISSAFFALAVMSCQRFDEMSVPGQTDWISFSTSTDVISEGTLQTKSMEGDITYEITDWEDQGRDIETKASLTTSLSGKAGVFGYNFTTWGTGVKPEVMYNMENTFDGSDMTPKSKVLWKNYKTGSLRFYSYAPYGKFTLSAKTDGGAPYLTYTVPTTNADQIDVLYAKSSDVPNTNRDVVPLQFKHAMTAVQFRLGIEGATIKSVTLKGVNNTGKLSLDGTWSNQSGSATYSVANADSLILLVPQTVPSGATIELVYTKDSKNTTIKANIDGQIWPVGKKVVYTLKDTNKPIQYIYFDLALGNIILTETTYSGYINVGYGTNNSQPVTGTHSDDNKYYIYCSVNGYDSDKNCEKVWSKNTGYKNQSDYNNRTTTGVIPVIPAYEENIYFAHKPARSLTDWGAFITNNQDPYAVRAAWDDGDQNYSTAYTISISGAENASSIFDVTLDRVFTRRYPTAATDSKKGGLSIGYDGSKFTNHFTEKVTIRLKNNNAISRIHYRKPLDSTKEGYLKITSADGDGVAKGTLTVTANRRGENEEPPQLVMSLIGAATDVGTDYNDERGKTDRQVKDLYFDGGIVFVGTQKYCNSYWSNNNPLLAVIGGVNSWSEITINGGILTAVSNNTSPAIGGGGGWESTGGKGVVTINGGTVYAYSFGVLGTFDSQETVVIPPAIGGGGTLGAYIEKGVYTPANAGPCDVTINGGNVYAYAVGGPAIGGGSCGRHAAGHCKLTINGGNVVAQSLAGTIGGRSVEAVNAIGGGRSGLVDGDGGTAQLIMTGGKLQAGSVGGGSVDERNTTGKIGSADITISGGEVTGQFIMAKGATTAPKFTMTGGTVKNSNTSDQTYKKVMANGGAVYMESGTCKIEGGTISNCSADLGGAVYMNGGEFTMSGGTIKGCEASTDGGAVYIEGGNATMQGDGLIDKNIASKGNGGGIAIKGGNFTMTGGSITNNSADADPATFKEGNGGGIYVSSQAKNVNVTISDGSIQYNAADRNGGGLCVDMEGANTGIAANINIGTVGGLASTPNISLNSAALSGGGMAVQGSGSKITINSGTVKGNVSAFVKNEDIRNDGGVVDLVGKNITGKPDQVNVNYKTIRFYANNEDDPEPSDEQRVITSTNSPLKPTAAALNFKKEFFHLDSWNTKRDGTGTSYAIDGGGKTMNITADVALYGQWVRNQ